MKKCLRRPLVILLVFVFIDNTGVCVMADNSAVVAHSLEMEFSGGATYDGNPVETNEIESWPIGPPVMVDSAILMEPDSNTILYAKGIHDRRYPASITKIMTALVALENSNLSDEVVFTEAGVSEAVEGNSHINCQVGEVFTMEQCLYAVMLKSANEVSTQVAITVGGSVEGFAEMMNNRAREIGCMDTHFTNANGLHSDDHYTTAYDMALIAKEAYKNEEFRKIISTKTYDIPATNMTQEPRNLSNHHAMLNSAEWGYEGCVGGKTGYTDEALNTLVTYCYVNDTLLIGVTMHYNGAQVVSDTILLMEYGYNNFKKERFPDEHIKSGGDVIIPKDADTSLITPTVTEGEGTSNCSVKYMFNGHEVGWAVTDNSQAKEEEKPAQPPEIEDTAKPDGGSALNIDTTEDLDRQNSSDTAKKESTILNSTEASRADTGGAHAMSTEVRMMLVRYIVIIVAALLALLLVVFIVWIAQRRR